MTDAQAIEMVNELHKYTPVVIEVMGVHILSHMECVRCGVMITKESSNEEAYGACTGVRVEDLD